MLAEDEEYEDAVLYERRSTPVLRSARPELVVPTPWTSRLWPGALNSRLWPRACAETGLRASMVAEPRPPVFAPLSWVVCIRAIQLDHLGEQRGPELVARCQRATMPSGPLGARSERRITTYCLELALGGRGGRKASALHETRHWRAGVRSGGRLRAYALTAEFNSIASARTLAQLIACTCHIACVAWRCTRMSRGS
jgi:hypothetical protein